MRVDQTRDRAIIEGFLRRDEAMHVYPIADLDDPFWDDTRWFGAFDGDRLRALCLVLEGLAMPIVSAVCAAEDAATSWLLEQVREELPRTFFYNLGPGLSEVLRAGRATGTRIDSNGSWLKMRLEDASACDAVEDTGVVPLGPRDFDEICSFLDRDAYLEDELGGHFFDARMLESGCYRAVRDAGRLISLGGVHVHSKRYGVAAIGNVVTRPDFRGRGLARRLSASIVRALQNDVATIGLNVREDNAPALRCYRSLGFRRVCDYEEGVATRD